MSTAIFDIETNGLLDQLDRVHSLVICDPDTKQVASYADQPGYPSIEEGVQALLQADYLVGHNIIKFDIPALEKVYPWFRIKGQWGLDDDRVIDTLVCSRLIWPELKVNDFKFRKKHPSFPGKLIGSHGLEAWGYRLGEYKGEFAKETDWSSWSEDMQFYCEQDVRVTDKLYSLILKRWPSDLSVWIEHEFQKIISEQEKNGFPFKTGEAAKLYAGLVGERQEIDEKLKAMFPPWWRPVHQHTPKRTMRRFVENENGKWHKRKDGWRKGWYEGLTEGCKLTKVKLQEFDPGSPDLVADRLIKVEGWKPQEFTSEAWHYGPYERKPSVSEDELAKLNCESARLIARRMMLSKRIGQIAEGQNAWLKLEQDGRIYGSVITNGAVTGRCTHRKPNMAQVPSSSSEYGRECRALFYAPEGMKLVGVDADSLELVGLAHYLALWDEGAFAYAVSTGSKEDGTDPHTKNQHAAGLSSRDNAKTFIYAFIYGAGDWKIGHIVRPEANDADKKKAGKALKSQFLKGMPALDRLMKAVSKAIKKRGYLRGLDGRVLPIRSEHSALNTLIQSCGAVIMKMATIFFWRKAVATGFVPVEDFMLVAHVHDEWQTLAREEIAEAIGELGVLSIEDAGEYLGLRCPVTGSADIGNNWSETH